MNDANLEKKQMSSVFGGQVSGSQCTASTYTVTPTGGQNDGDDSWAGECEGTLPPAQK